MEIPNWPPDNIAEMSKKLEEADLMRHGMANKKLNRTSEHRKALIEEYVKFFNKI